MKTLTRRELFKEMVSKDTLKVVAGAWFGFSKPFTADATPKKESLLDKVHRLNSQNTKHPVNHNRKEG